MTLPGRTLSVAYMVLVQKASSVAPTSVTVDHVRAWPRAVVTAPAFFLFSLVLERLWREQVCF